MLRNELDTLDLLKFPTSNLLKYFQELNQIKFSKGGTILMKYLQLI